MFEHNVYSLVVCDRGLEITSGKKQLLQQLLLVIQE